MITENLHKHKNYYDCEATLGYKIFWKREKVENRVLYFRGQNECFTGG